MVAGDHRDPYAAGVAFLHRFDRFLARRIEEADKPKQHEVLRQIGRTETSGLDAGIGRPRQRQHALALAGHRVGRLFEIGAIERLFASSVLLPVAMVEDRLGRALDEQDLAALRGLVQGRHEPMFGFERDNVDARIRRLLLRAVDSEFRGERIERALGRIALDFPDALLVAQLGVVAERRDAAQKLEHRVLAYGRAVLHDLAFAGVAVAGDLQRIAGGRGGHDHHFHQRQRAGLVRADARDRAQRFDRGQAPHDRVAGRHALDADRKRDGDESRQSFGDHRHGDAGHRLEHFDERNVANETPVSEGDRADDQNDDGDRIAELLDLEQERGLERADAGEQLVDAAQFGLASGGDDHAGRPAGHHQRAGIGHARAIADGRLGRDGLGRLVRRNRFAGERGFFRAQVLDLGEADVGGDLVAGFEEHDVARHERLRRDHRGLAIAQGSRFRREHVADRIERLLRPAFLNEAEQSVDDDHSEDDRRVEHEAHHQLDEAGGDENVDENIVELLQEAHERAHACARSAKG